MNLTPENNNTWIKRFESMLKTNNIYFFDAIEFENIINYYLDSAKTNLAKQALQLGLAQHPNSFILKLLKAEILIFEGNLDRSFELLNQLQALEPNNSEVYVQKAAIFSKKKKHKEAVNLLYSALQHTADEADILSLIGMEFLYIDDFKKALSSFAKCLEVDFEDYSALHNVIFCFNMQSKHKEAIEYLKNYVNNKNPYSEVAWHQLGIQYFTIKKYKKALKAFEYAILIDEEFIGGYIEKAKTLEKLKKYRKAIYQYKIALELDDPTSFVYHKIAFCYEKLQKKSLAIQFYKKAITEDPLSEKNWIAITSILIEKKKHKKALKTIRKALETDPDKASYLKLYAQINLELKNYNTAINTLYKHLSINNKELDVWISLADNLCYNNAYEEALKVLLKSEELFKNFAEIEYRLSALFFKHNNTEKGEKHLLKAFKIDFPYHYIIKDFLPEVYKLKQVQQLIKKYKGHYTK